MRDILESCVRVDELAQAVYLDMQARCTDPATAELCGQMGLEEAAHVQWWRELLAAWDEGLLPDVWSASETALQTLNDTIAQLERFTRTGTGPIDAGTALTTAARIEFFALDPVFTEMLELAEPGIARSRHDAYAAHVDRLIDALEKAFGPDTLAGFLASVLRRAQIDSSTLSSNTMHDSLTGLGNRRALAVQARQWASWAARYGSAVTVLLIDVDGFRQVNDAWGHGIGDRLLVGLARGISGTVRSADLVARYGADEFIVLAPELEPEGARALAERLLRAVRSLRIEAEGGAYVSVTASIGIATVFDPPDSEPRPLDVMLAAADRSLYAAKRAGRDRAADPVVLLHEMPLE
jgi:diguanylate cyclase (GGDEF)-like protein